MVQLTKKAAQQIKLLQVQEGKTDAYLRISVVGGGCSGLSYKLAFESKAEPKDKCFFSEEVKILVDPKSYLFIKGTVIDYEGGLNGSGFTFQNPNAAKHCGCGTSFAV